ncbi:MAG: hypothetical protein LBP58_09905, partial [Azoarcus sp.]|nr:hypothetical protein [Azoarcus sp.]
PGNFRELSSSITRLATLAHNGRITETDVDEEIARLRAAWQDIDGTGCLPRPGNASNTGLDSIDAKTDADLVQAVLGVVAARTLDLFEHCQLQTVLQVCRRSPNLSAAGRMLFAQSRQHKKQPNDADRLRKYLLRFGLDWERVTG